MARPEELLPIFIKWETGLAPKVAENVRDYFVRAREYNIKKNGGILAGDKGGYTIVGITHKTFEDYLRKNGIKTTEAEAHRAMAVMTFDTWLSVFRSVCWDKIGGDGIRSQSVANTIADWCWISGPAIIKKVQAIVAATPDGVVGPKTIAAINNQSAKMLFNKIQAERKKHIATIVRLTPCNKKFEKGWLNRINSYTFKE